MDPKHLARRVAALRKALQLNQIGLAKKAGISQSYVSMIESGDADNVTLKVFHKLADALGVAPSELMSPAPIDNELAMTLHPALRQFAIDEELSFSVVEKLAIIPREEQQPNSVEEWRRLYKAVQAWL